MLLAARASQSQVVLPISSGDRLDVVVAGEGPLSRVYTVDQDGNIFLDLVGKVPVKDQTLAQVRDALIKKLSQFIKAPQVSVEFKERAQITVGFTGDVGKPGPVMLPKGKRLLDGLAQAEGLKLTADSHNVRFQRRDEPTPRILDLSKVLDKDASQNIELLDGDSIFVPALPMYNIEVRGAVNKPEVLLRKEKLRLLDAILAAGGFTDDANRRAVELIRKGSTEPQVFNFDDVLTGKDGNPVLEDGDSITVPAFKKITVKVQGSVAKPGTLVVREGTTVQALIADAGGFLPDGNKTDVTLKAIAASPRKLSLPEVNSPDAAVLVPDGAEVTVGQLHRYAVIGSGVAKPEVYPIPEDGKTQFQLTDALTLAGGPIDRAKKRKFYLMRKDPATGKSVVQPLNYDAILQNKAENPVIRPYDVIFVDADPENKPRQSILEKITGVLGAFSFGGF